MNLWVIALLSACCSVGFGIWAWNSVDREEFQTVITASGEEARDWAEKAKVDRSVEIVTYTGGDGALPFEAIPREEIDSHVRTNSEVFVRRWYSQDKAMAMMATLSDHGYPDAGEIKDKAAENQAAKRTKTTLLTMVTIIAGLSAVSACVVAMIRQRRIGRRRVARQS